MQLLLEEAVEQEVAQQQATELTIVVARVVELQEMGLEAEREEVVQQVLEGAEVHLQPGVLAQEVEMAQLLQEVMENH